MNRDQALFLFWLPLILAGVMVDRFINGPEEPGTVRETLERHYRYLGERDKKE